MPKTALNQDQWRRVEEIYHAALERQPGSRAAFLAEACNDDSALRLEVESLLAAEGSLLDRPALEIAAQLLDNGAPLASGTQLGPYRIENLLGAGGMGRVYRARDTRLNRTVALKVSKDEFSERFEGEARAVAALNHPNICQLYDIGPNYLVMELVEGAPLKGPLPLAKSVEYAAQILDALDAAHRKGLIHRDLKPSNIMVSKQGLKLLDFGLAKQTVQSDSEATEITRLTGTGTIVGTLQYMSPEQLQGKPVDVRSDLFSFGCVLYEMLSGKRAFEGETSASVIAAVLEREPAPLEISPPVERVLRRCLAKDADQRFQTAVDLKAALKWAVEQSSEPAKPARSWWLGVAVAAIALAFVGGWAVSRFGQRVATERVVRLPIVPPKGARFLDFATSLSLSPDERYLTYSAAVDGKQGIWLQALDGSPGRLLTDQLGATSVIWSPDSKSVGWWAGGAVWRTDLTGAQPSLIYEQSFGRGAAWTTDGRILLGSPNAGLVTVPASGGPATRLTSLDKSLGETAHDSPELLREGKFLYRAENTRPDKDAIYAARLSNPSARVRVMLSPNSVKYAPGGDGKDYLLIRRDPALVAQEFDMQKLQLVGEPHVLTEQLAFPIGPVVPAGVSGRGMLLYGSGSSQNQFAWRDRTGKLLKTLGPPGRYTDFSLSPDGRRIALAQLGLGSTSDLWIMDTERSILSRFTSSSGLHRFPVWSPDMKTLVFRNRGMYRKNISGSGDEEPSAKAENFRRPYDWSRDGRLILYGTTGAGAEGNTELWIVPVTIDGKPAEGGRPRPYIRTPFNASLGRFSPEPDPHWVAYQSDETGRFEIYLASFPEPTRRIQITSDGGRVPQWGPDGRELFYIRPDNKLMSVTLRMGSAGIEPSAPHELFQLAGVVVEGGNPTWYAVSPEGKRILVKEWPENSQQLELVMNWPALLKKQHP